MGMVKVVGHFIYFSDGHLMLFGQWFMGFPFSLP
jgi:hypothetical protein